MQRCWQVLGSGRRSWLEKLSSKRCPVSEMGRLEGQDPFLGIFLGKAATGDSKTQQKEQHGLHHGGSTKHPCPGKKQCSDWEVGKGSG